MFRKALEEKRIVFDGAMGTMIQAVGQVLGDVPERMNIDQADVIESIHKAYVKAGADVVSSNTFGASAYKLKDTGLTVKDVVSSGIEIAKRSGAYVALDLGPVGQMMKPIGQMTFEEAYDAYKEQISYGQEADLILVETLSDLNEARAAVLAAKENSDLPIIVSMTFQEDGRTLTGVTPESFVYSMEALGVDGLGVNCSLGPDLLEPIVKRLVQTASVPVLVQANAGLPVVVNGLTTFDYTPEKYKSSVESFIDIGASMIGGCCGTTPDHIKAISSIDRPNKPVEYKGKYVVCSSGKVHDFSDFTIIGERINPTGNKKLKASLRSNAIDGCIREGINQSTHAHVLDINVGLPDIDELDMMKRVVDELAHVTDCPLQIDSSKSKVLEAGLRRYPGVGIINSLNGKQKSMDRIFPIVKKYGAMVICLTLDEEGIPKTAQDRIKIAEKMINEAKKYDIPEERLIIDCLVLTVSAQQAEVLETIKAIEYITDHYKVQTTLGISNVSYGMPNRPLLTRTFLSLGLYAGLNSAIMDPLDRDLRSTLLASQVLLNKDEGGSKYIEEVVEVVAEKKDQDNDLLTMILNGYKEEVKTFTLGLLKEKTPLAIVNDVLVPTLDIVGLQYEHKTIFLPQLIRAAETIGTAFDVVKSSLPSGDDQVSKGKVIMATVHGDVHDIGKNLVKILLENYGFDVIDLGKDVPPEHVLETVKETGIKLVGLSALMTTTVISMEKTIKLLEDTGAQVFVGGAVLTKDYAATIGADYYCKDAKASVKIAQDYYQALS